MKELSVYPVVHEQTVAWGDMDAFGHVNNVQYYRYIESARIAYLMALNIFDQDILTVVASSQCKYLSPVFYPDVLHIGARIEELRNSAFRMHYVLWSKMQNQVVATGEAVLVCVSKHDSKKVNIPDLIRNKIIQLESNVGHHLVSH
ncbi:MULTISPECIES: thioesterase family protein [Acinetobacter]|uniref:acyl-CoA thioesterase n=1 Tax=Acinetobacter TaxID=469 RepID=UPI00077836D4|nr:MULTISPECIES: thioesterase family protein [Acinetobacter]KXZ63122.1 Long-chain acyl-CoA thioesterase FadM [Acinetobacter venetianus]MBC69330.1 acyl-CoA thioesterase [Acinetobacter sp.]MBT48763.1 acyl-CoA thioesterase [Acinetobacter sp.]HIQ34399.1 acyl-CoA thioesterase [Acinetobacter venetianus]HJP48977.1 thioesterase family protein [Acinetobacter venetianus]